MVLLARVCEGSVRCMAWHEPSKTLVSGSFDQTLIIWRITDDTVSSSQLGRLYGHRFRVKCCAFNSEGTFLVSGDSAGHVALWDVAQQACLRMNTPPPCTLARDPASCADFRGCDWCYDDNSRLQGSRRRSEFC